MFDQICYNLAFGLYFLSAILFILSFVAKKEGVGKSATWIAAIGCLIYTVGFVMRWIEGGHAPFANLYESVTFFVYTTVLFFVYLDLRYKMNSAGTFIMPLAFLGMGYANLLDPEIEPLVPALQSNWLLAHVALCFIGYAAFAVSYALVTMYLLKAQSKKEVEISTNFATINFAFFVAVIASFAVFVSLQVMESSGYRINLFGFSPMLASKVLILGSWVVIFAGLHAVLAARSEKIKDKINSYFAVLNISFVLTALFYFVLEGIAKKLSYGDPQSRMYFEGSGFAVTETIILLVLFCISMIVFLWKKDSMSDLLPDLHQLDNVNYLSIAFGFPFLTAGIITGAIWANEAWGTYWSWDPKETWSLITWFVYAAYLHARYMAGWKGVKAAYLSVYGFLSVIFTYFGVNLLLSGLHSYN